MHDVYACFPHIPEEWAAEVQCFDRSGTRLFFDLGSLLSQMKAAGSPEARAAVSAAEAALSEAVVSRSATPFFVDLPVHSHSGLTTYIEQTAYPSLNTAWRQTAWGRMTGKQEVVKQNNNK